MNYEQHRDDFERAFYKEFGFIPTHFGNGYKESSANDAWDGYCWALADVAKQVGKLDDLRKALEIIAVETTGPAAEHAATVLSDTGYWVANAVQFMKENPQQSAPVVQLSEPPKGWKLVPIEPTPEMLDNSVISKTGVYAWDRADAGHSYMLMLAAAPTTPKDAS